MADWSCIRSSEESGPLPADLAGSLRGVSALEVTAGGR